MEIYTVKRITEPDFGCEDTGRTEPAALLILELNDEDHTEKCLEVSESILAERGIDEGKQVCFTLDGRILKYVRVVAAVIRKDDKVFATARGYGEHKDKWEFPGGKIEAGETPEEALVREIREELAVTIEVGDLIRTIEYDYPKFHLSMDCFWAHITDGEPVLKEAEAAKWLSKEHLRIVDWLPADLELIKTIEIYW